MKKNTKILIIILFINLIFSQLIFATVHISKQPHENAVTMFAQQLNSSNIYSVGQDGFIINWNTDGNGIHFQVSDMEIRMISVNPVKAEIAVYETDGFSIHRVSVWNWQTQTRRYAKRFTDSVTSLSYSAKGTLLMVGTAAVDGLIFFDVVTGKQLNKLTATTGTVTMVMTSDTEKTCCTYSTAGHISYYNLLTGERKERFTVQKSLLQPTLYYDNMLFSGVNGNNLLIYLATTGEKLAEIPFDSPIIYPSITNPNILYVLSWDGRKTYTLSTVTANNDLNDFSVQQIKKFTLNNQKNNITCVFERDNELFIGTQSGDIYSTKILLPVSENINVDTSENENTTNTIDNTSENKEKIVLPVDNILPKTEKLYDRILDIASLDSDFFFLSDDSLFCSSYFSTDIVKIIDNTEHYTNLSTGNDELYLWAKGTTLPVKAISRTGVISTLYTPSKELENVRVFSDILIGIEGSTTVTVYSKTTNEKTSVYSGTGLQDAILYSPNDLYVSKSSSSNPKSPLIHVNMTTKETVMMPLTGDISFSLDFEQDQDNPLIYGLSVSANGLNKNTMIFSFNTFSKTFSPVLQWADEDTDAFVTLYDGRIYTNIGKTQVRSHQIKNKKEVKLIRSASLPVKVVRNEVSVLVLNKDGSISWYNPDSQYILSDWYLTVNNEWMEF